MHLGFVSAIFPDHSLEEVVKFAAAVGFRSVELMCWPPGRADRRYAGVTHVDVTALDTAAVERIRGLFKQNGVQISGMGYYPNPLSGEPHESQSAVAHLHKVIDGAADLGVNVVNTFVGRNPQRTVDENWPSFLGDVAAFAYATPSSAGFSSGSRIARCCSVKTSGRAARTWRQPPRSGGGCSPTSPARILG